MDCLYLIFVLFVHMLPRYSIGLQNKNVSSKWLGTDDGQKLFQGDMLLTSEQMEERFSQDLSGRKAIPEDLYRWPRGVVPYKISIRSLLDKRVIQQALNHWMERTCLEFRELGFGETATNFLYFVKENGCWSSVGMAFELQKISIGSHCNTVPIIVHEVGHALGFFHEHSRSDRDSYVRIFPENVEPEMFYNFQKETTRSYNVPYDYTSIMHYQKEGLSVDPIYLKTLMPVDPRNAYLIKDQQELSFRDVQMANLMYRCNENCVDSLQCENGGYLSPECQCLCPPGTIGETCQLRYADYYAPNDCGGLITEEGIVKSLGYPEKQIANKLCTWWIRAAKNTKVVLEFKDFDLEGKLQFGPSFMFDKCVWDYVEIRRDNLYHGAYYCGKDIETGNVFVSNENELVVEHKANAEHRRGFEAIVTFRSEENNVDE